MYSDGPFNGDLLWVRETWGHFPASLDEEENILYRATCENPLGWPAHRGDISEYVVWHPSLHMFKKYARLWLRITNVRVERVQEISDGDVAAEGVEWGVSYDISDTQYSPAQKAFRRLWDSLNAKRGYPWESNPWVWVIGFEKAKP